MFFLILSFDLKQGWPQPYMCSVCTVLFCREGLHLVYGHIRHIHTVLANPKATYKKTAPRATHKKAAPKAAPLKAADILVGCPRAHKRLLASFTNILATFK